MFILILTFMIYRVVEWKIDRRLDWCLVFFAQRKQFGVCIKKRWAEFRNSAILRCLNKKTVAHFGGFVGK